MTTKLEVYNFALINLGDRKLATITEAREPRYLLDDIYTTVTGYCLAQAMWRFALRASAALAQSAGSLGFTYAYAKPTDLIHALSVHETVGGQQLYQGEVVDLGASFYANVATLFCRYSSNDATNGGMLLTGWPESFTAYVAAALARRICLSLTGSERRYQFLQQLESEYYLTAASTEAVSRVIGQVPFNVEAHNRLNENPAMQGDQLLPFAARDVAMAHLHLREPGQGNGQQG